MQIVFAAATDVGRERDHNEDSHLVVHEHGLFVMCDGMGGHLAGEVASKLAVDTIHTIIDDYISDLDTPETPEARGRALETLIRSAVEYANRAVHALSRNEKTLGAGTTCSALLVRDGKAALAHVGDSRVYLARYGQIHQLSLDHTYAAEAIARGVLTPEEAAEIPEAAYLTRAVGPHPSVVVDTLLFDLLPGDTLLLCSDGLHGYIQSETELLDRMVQPIEEVPKQLIALANERGGEDNITAVVLRVLSEEAGDEFFDRTTQVAADLATLQHIDMFTEFSYAELSRVTQVMGTLEVADGEEILHQGECTESLYVLVEGSAQVVRDGEVLATLSAGTHFGEMALLTQRPRTATVRAAGPCRIRVLERESFYDLAQQDAVLGVKFLWKLAQTLSLRLEESCIPCKPPSGRATDQFGIFPSPFSKR
ncbi:MAG TPA: cyclic nucleotide-binding domain-containing protein [Polyangiaceae bacterium]|jgi:serine/threonine protein phosphatase PrpC|nr:MAG: Serine/threonine phosphatase stp [Deltaproteobacteria bacterium ADurb.Bin207]HNS99599.1 cyclic nucleotide-binding domain-containing protein [Polyangiaceae bacterium]HNZ20852.1 cyclic nucleotide-binding domain-containing protein [Polyangiaceae bacterium]HOD21425.1 cyclic nucleotide-binding domain-containing protein [Polyangiaceae bacterium]HOE47534.1 cyclic nucleotide-binding domain-containing protein [Polyangiaceae bacterium]